MSLLSKIFGDPNKKVIEKLQPTVDKINELESQYKKYKNEDFAKKAKDIKNKIKKDKSRLEDYLPDVFAMVREVSRRKVNMRHFDVQLIGGIVMHQGKIAEMKTGEGKTLAANLALSLNALTGQGCHLVTVNDYLARRDCGWMGPVYQNLGLSCGCIIHDGAFIYDPDFEDKELGDERISHLKPVSRREAYQADITYGTNNEFGFDYLRDNMVPDIKYMVQRSLHYAIIDEVDSILIDEARTPLIISAPAEESADKYYKFAKLIPQLEEGPDYNVDEKMKAATLTEEGISKMENWLNMDNIYQAGGIEMVHHIEQALKAHALFKKDKDYVIKEGEIVIVDEFTGRLMPGRRFSEGLHQAIEAKEDVEIKNESQTLATISFQNYFRIYDKLSGMTGTAATEAEEFHKIYDLDVVVIPTNEPMVREDLNDSIYKTEKGKFKAILREIKRDYEVGQPVLVGTISIEKNELLGELLEREGIKYELLNAKNHEKEAQIIRQAGRKKAVTVATNMAGRGVDIVLGGQPFNKEKAQEIKELGGLKVIGTERHESRRIDNQLRGRSGRQGDPGSSQFFISLEDELMRIFGSDRMKNVMNRLGVPDDMPIENKMISRSIEKAQKKVESRNFDIRKHLVEYDDVMNKHRQVLYKKRKEFLTMKRDKLKDKMMLIVEDEIERVVYFHTAPEAKKEWDIEEVYEVVDTIFPIPIESRIKLEEIKSSNAGEKEKAEVRTRIVKYLMKLANKSFDQMSDQLDSPHDLFRIIKGIVLRTIDTLWIEHLSQMTHLRTGIGLRGYGQQDPLVEYKKESYKLFNRLLSNINAHIIYSLYKIPLAKNMSASPVAKSKQVLSAPSKHAKEKREKPTDNLSNRRRQNKNGKKIGRNDPCPCGSGKKYKKCCGR
ncbi:MAG: preprotein translocase subunit SecA [Patescibacteria group bacterium]|nr:preprotein translocase subunit SecA [Patescibacteria group bacterium]